MPPTSIPVTNPAGKAVLGSYAATVPASSVFLHEQNAHITYTQVSANTPAGGWPNDCEAHVFFKIELNTNVDESVFDWSLSAGNTYNTFTCMSGIVNSFDSSTGLGTSGYIHFKPGSYTRLAVSSDYEYHNSYEYDEVMIKTPIGQRGNLKDDAVTLQAFVLKLNSWIRQGGLEYSSDSTQGGRNMTQPEYGWRTDLMC
tara:strand:+ start:2299 stop:2895 length:597 start_codon:yes stop_codon:yes gene_type:complete